jgi:O-methyltransferase involved in polyketide biosynthesis
MRARPMAAPKPPPRARERATGKAGFAARLERANRGLVSSRAVTTAARDFTTISPTARSLLLMKSQTALPFARQAAALMFGAEGLKTELAAMNREPVSGLRLQHFESRYRSLDRLLADSSLTRILELGAGLSFRGLDLAGRDPRVHYLDTDLPEMAALKADLVDRLQPAPPVGRLEVLPLDALDPAAFSEAAARLAPGPLAIVNEGLLVYLDPLEKRRLAAHIREALRACGGAWLTADVYVRGPAEVRAPLSARAQAFLDRHNVEQNKFADWESAERFFVGEGFVIRRKLSPSDDPRHVRESWVLTL